MSFRTIHQPYFEVISIFSNAPISKNKQGKFHRSIAKCVYSVLLTICLDVYFIKVLVDQVISHFVNRESNGLTLMIVFSSRQICSSLTFAYIMLVCVGVARSHADLLNLLIDLERSVHEHKVRFNCTHSNAKPRWMESNWPAATLVVWNISVNALMSKIYDINEGTHIDVLLVWIASMQFCIVLYVRMLMTLLTSNCRQLRGCFVHSHRSMLASDLVILDQVADAKNVLIHAFGGILLVNFFYDVITVLVTTFWAIFTLANYGASNHVVDMAFVLGGYTIPFVSKVFLVTNAAEGLAAEVSLVRVTIVDYTQSVNNTII